MNVTTAGRPKATGYSIGFAMILWGSVAVLTSAGCNDATKKITAAAEPNK